MPSDLRFPVPFFPRFPWCFYIGLLPLICLLWLWADSTRTMTVWARSLSPLEVDTITAANSAITIRKDVAMPGQAGQPLPSVFSGWGLSTRWGSWSRADLPSPPFVAGPWLFPPCQKKSQTNPLPPGWSLRTDSRALPFWLILLCYQPPWLGISWWQALRRKEKRAATAAAEATEPPLPLPPSVLGSFARRLPVLFYLGIFPALLLCWLWGASRTDLMEWHRTRSWVHDYGITAADSALHFKHQWIAGDLPADVETYPWHQLWEEDGRRLAFKCQPNGFKGTASLFPAIEMKREDLKKEYLTLSISQVSLPLWQLLLVYLPLWLGISWWQARRRRRRIAAMGPQASDLDERHKEPRMGTD